MLKQDKTNHIVFLDLICPACVNRKSLLQFGFLTGSVENKFVVRNSYIPIIICLDCASGFYIAKDEKLKAFKPINKVKENK